MKRFRVTLIIRYPNQPRPRDWDEKWERELPALSAELAVQKFLRSIAVARHMVDRPHWASIGVEEISS